MKRRKKNASEKMQDIKRTQKAYEGMANAVDKFKDEVYTYEWDVGKIGTSSFHELFNGRDELDSAKLMQGESLVDDTYYSDGKFEGMDVTLIEEYKS